VGTVSTLGPDETDATPEPAEPHIGEPPATGDADVDAALADLRSAVTQTPLEEQIEAFEAVHRTLQSRLTDVEG
jgi:hypothetical protein